MLREGELRREGGRPLLHVLRELVGHYLDLRLWDSKLAFQYSVQHGLHMVCAHRHAGLRGIWELRKG